MSNTKKKADYEVGYKKPPVHTRWKKGQCPNPSGRGKRRAQMPDFAGIVAEELTATVTINGTGETINKFRAAFRQLVNGSAKGNLAAQRLLPTWVAWASAKAQDEPETTARGSKDVEAEIDAMLRDMNDKLKKDK